MASQSHREYVSPSLQPIADAPQERTEENRRGREQSVTSFPSREGNDPFREGSMKSAASSLPAPHVSVDVGRSGAEQQHFGYNSPHTSIPSFNEKHAEREDYTGQLQGNVHLSLPSQTTRGEVLGSQGRRQPNRDSQRPHHASFVQRQSTIHQVISDTPEMKASVAQRLQPTLDVAIAEKNKYVLKAKWTGWALNAAIGMQVLLGSLTTGLSAVAVSGRKSTAVSTTILGALATLVASYLARARGSNEPELSIARVKDLEQFIRECEAFKMDHGHTIGDEFDRVLISKRNQFEELLGNANGERRMSPPV